MGNRSTPENTKYIVSCQIQTHLFKKEINLNNLSASYEDIIDLIKDIISDEFIDDIYDELFTPPFEDAVGYFDDPSSYEIIYDNAFRKMQDKYSNVFISIKPTRVEEENSTIDVPVIDVIEKIIEDYKNSEQSICDMATVIFECFSRFVEEAKWYIGLKTTSGDIITEVKKWPVPEFHNNEYKWIIGQDEYEPIIWYGLQGDLPIDCWCISKQSMRLSVLDESRSGGFDWDIIIKDDGETYEYWHVFECGGIVPTAESLIRNCPMKLEFDGTVLEDLDKFIYNYQNGK